MIIWGGFTYNGAYNYYNDGGRYNFAANAWTPITTIGAPTPRQYHSAVWTGTEMIIWGGLTIGPPDINHNNGARYNPASNAWFAISTVGAPTARANHTAVWTGNEMIIFGGRVSYSGTGTDANDGARYNPVTDTWMPISSTNAPGRSRHSAAWTGSEMIVWGGMISGGGIVNEGARYNIATDTWVQIDSSFAPYNRFLHSTIWTGHEMIVWGGDGGGARKDGGSYDPTSNIWTPVSTVPRAPERRKNHTAVWTGSEMIIFGGDFDNTPCFNDTWSCTPPRLLYLYLKP
jgi:Kelch motif